MVQPSCPVLLVHQDDAFRKSLIAALDQQNFTVTFAVDGDGAVDMLRSRRFNVVLVGVNLDKRTGFHTLEHLRDVKSSIKCGVILLGDPNPQLRTYATWADETLMKPVDAAYVASRARTYCACG
jgi:DNA-binding response OmpR family regulator